MGPYAAAIATLIGLVAVALLMQFIMMNLIVQCESWVQPECVTPSEFLKMYLDRFK